MEKEQFFSALKELKETTKKKFDQSVDFIINLKNFDIKKENLNFFVTLPYETKKKRICAFLENKNELFDKCITSKEFENWQKKDIKKLVKDYDFFVANAKLMPAIALRFGKILGPAGKMPSPQLGIIQTEDKKTMMELKEKISKTIRIRTKEPSIKVMIGKQSMPEEQLAENALAVYNAVLAALPRKKENISNVIIKFTMSKPFKIRLE